MTARTMNARYQKASAAALKCVYTSTFLICSLFCLELPKRAVEMFPEYTRGKHSAQTFAAD